MIGKSYMTKKSKKEYRQSLLRGTPYQRAPFPPQMNISKEMVMELIESHKHESFGSYANGCSHIVIAKAEKRLGLAFPPSYIWWLVNYGGGQVGGTEIYSVYEKYHDQEEVDDIAYPGDIVFVAERARKRGVLPNGRLEIMNIDGDEVYYFDTSQSPADGEWPICLLEAGADQAEMYARNFLEFLYKIIR